MMTPRLPDHVRRGFAVVLALLILTPFTAPFSSCPLWVLVAGNAATPPAGVLLTPSTQGDDSGSDLSSVQLEEKLKDEAMLYPTTIASSVVVISIDLDPPLQMNLRLAPSVSFVLRV